MFGSTTLEVAIGLVFIYLLLSLIATAINEGIATFINKRGKNLFDGITNLLNDPDFTGLAQQIYSHGLVDGISQFASDVNKPNRVPSYMSSDTFALALIDILGARGVAASLPDQATLEAAYTQAQAASATAEAAASAAPGNSALAAAAATAKAALADAERQRDAKKLSTPPAAQKKIIDWQGKIAIASLLSQDLQQALRAGRLLASQHPDPLDNIQAAVEDLPTGPTQESLLVLIAKTRRDVALVASGAATVADHIEHFQKNIEKWFDDSMDRVAGWYKRWAQIWLLGIGCLLVFAGNADTLTLAKRFNRDTALRASVVAAADDAIKNTPGNAGGTTSPNGSAVDQVQPVLKASEQLNLPLGWHKLPNDPYGGDQVPVDFVGWLQKLLGLLITVAAISLGAPFWFDTLSKLINIRGAGTPPGETKTSASQTKTK